MGLDSIRSRTEMLGGKLVLETNPGEGCTFILKEIVINTTKV